MMIPFFFMLRDGGMKTSITELLTLLDAMKRGLAEHSVDDFYFLARATLVKDESQLDRFDRIFGAFFKGMLTTVLATPCSGPMLTPALTWAVSQPPIITYTGFFCVGLGMASPYLLIGAFPKLVSFLPKPGAWMDTFKNIMGFVLMGTVIFLLTFIDIPYVVPTVAFLIGLWAAFWWIGRVSIVATLDKKCAAWLAGIAFAAFIGLGMFGGPFYPFSKLNLRSIMQSRFDRAIDRALATRLGPESTIVTAKESDNELPWQPYSKALLEQLTSAKKTVFIDFTADW